MHRQPLRQAEPSFRKALLQKKNMRWAGFFGILIASAVVALIFFQLWVQGRFLPSWISWQECEQDLDLDNNGTTETLALHQRQLKISNNTTVLFQTDTSWFVSDVLVGDINHDNSQEIICLLWKRGSFGKSRPFWIKQDDINFSQHIFIWTMQEGHIQAIWQSSAIDFEIASISLNDKQQVCCTTPDGRKSCWAWLSWGLVCIDMEDT